MKLLVHIVTFRRLPLLRKCCESVAAALPSGAEVLIRVNGNDPETRDWLTELGHPAFRWETGPRVSLARARNQALLGCEADVFYCLDDDVIVPPDLFARALKRFAVDPGLAILGGPNLNPPGCPRREALFGAIMTSPFAAPLVRSRYGGGNGMAAAVATEQDLMFCNLAIRRELLPPGLRFREDLVSNEETLFLYEARQRGLSLQMSSDLFVYHHRRPNLMLFARQIFSYGHGRGQQVACSPRSTPIAFAAPALLWIVLLVSIFFPPPRLLLFLLVGIYFASSWLGALLSRELRGLRAAGVLLAGPLTALVHLSYGMGLWRGLFFPSAYDRDGIRRTSAPEPARETSPKTGWLLPSLRWLQE